MKSSSANVGKWKLVLVQGEFRPTFWFCHFSGLTHFRTFLTSGAEGITAHIFDSRGETCTLAIHLPSSMTLLLLSLSRSPNGSLLVTPITQLPALSTTPIFGTRSKILDLLILTPEQTWSLVTVSGRVDEIQGPGRLPAGRRVVKLEGDRSRTVVLQLDDGTRWATSASLPEKGLALKTLETLSLLLSLDDFVQFRKAVGQWRVNEPGATVMDAIVGVLDSLWSPSSKEPPIIDSSASLSNDPWAEFLRKTSPPSTEEIHDPILRNLSSSTPRHATPDTSSNPHTILAAPKNLQAVIFGLHLLAEDAKLMKETQGECIVLCELLARLTAAVGLFEWAERYRKILGLAISLDRKQGKAFTFSPVWWRG